jgi:hypothetical protein
MTIALIDADVIAYRAGFSSQKTRWNYTHNGKQIEFGFGISKMKAKAEMLLKGINVDENNWESVLKIDNVAFALHTVKTMLYSIVGDTSADKYKCFLSTPNDTTLYRFEYAKTETYKGNRKDFKKPEHYEAIREYLLKYYNTEEVSGIEADDALAISQSSDTIICSIDKDLLQVPGQHYNFVKKNRISISEREGIRNLYSQALTGDNADNIRGLYNIGPKKAAYILEKCVTEKDHYFNCEKAYKLYSGREDYLDFLHENMNLLYLQRKPGDRWHVPA